MDRRASVNWIIVILWGIVQQKITINIKQCHATFKRKNNTKLKYYIIDPKQFQPQSFAKIGPYVFNGLLGLEAISVAANPGPAV